MMTDELYEIDAISMQVSRVLNLATGESKTSGSPGMDHSGHDESHHMSGSHSHDSDGPAVKPTWASPNPDKPHVYVSGNGDDKIYVVNTESWSVSDVWESPGKAPYNLEPTYDGECLVVTYKGEGAVGVWDIDEGKQVVKLPTSRRVTHGVVISPDDRFAFVTSEGIGGETGTIDILDLEALEIVDTVEVGKQAAGIAFWKIEE